MSTYKIGECEICGKPIMSNQGRMAQQGMVYKDDREQFSKKKLHWHTACFAKKELSIEIDSRPFEERAS